MIPFRLVGGRVIDLENPKPEDFTIEDVARGLSNCCRFAGQLRHFYSVAQHSLLVASLIPKGPQWQRFALLHDASEAYCGDVTRDLKHSPVMAGYRELEDGVQRAIEARFGIEASETVRAEAKRSDVVCAVFENDVLKRDGSTTLRSPTYAREGLPAVVLADSCWTPDDPHALDPFFAWPPRAAERAFLRRAKELGIE